jgi:hypothetical protein
VANSNNTMRDTSFISKDLAESAFAAIEVAPHAGVITLRKLQFSHCQKLIAAPLAPAVARFSSPIGS